MTETKIEHIYRKTLENTRDRLDDFEEQYANKEVYSAFDELTGIVEKGLSQASKIPVSTDKLSVEKLKEELERCIQTLITISILANGDENIVIGNFVDSRLSKLAKTHENVTKYIEKVTGKNIDVVLAENEALAAIGGDDEQMSKL